MLSHYLMFNRDCAQALETYVAAFGAQLLEKQTYADMPPNPEFPVAEADKGLVLHSRLQIGEQEIMGADASTPRTAGDAQYVSVTTVDEGLVRRAWEVLAQDAHIYMELTPSFFAAAHGSLRDRHGINWMFTALRPGNAPTA